MSPSLLLLQRLLRQPSLLPSLSLNRLPPLSPLLSRSNNRLPLL